MIFKCHKYMYTRIHNEYYDISKFDHPGGKRILKKAIGIDATSMFESHHPFVNKNKLNNILYKFKVMSNIRDDKPFLMKSLTDDSNIIKHFEYKSNFGTELVHNVGEYFNHDNNKTKATFKRYTMNICFYILNIISMFYWLRGDWYGLFLYPIHSWIVNANCLNDVYHFSLTKNKKINEIMNNISLYLPCPLFCNHHNVTNNICIINHCFEIFIEPFILPIKLENVIKIVRLFVNIVLPFLLHGYLKGFLFIVIPFMFIALLFVMCYDIIHIDNLDIYSHDWYINQIITTINFKIRNILYFYFTGGMNYQIEHSLFPNINPCHYPYIQPIVKELCCKHKIPYRNVCNHKDIQRKTEISEYIMKTRKKME